MKTFVETGAVISKDGEPIYWHAPGNASSGFMPDNRDLWLFFRDNWARIQGFAHTHPEGVGNPSWTDLTTFAAIERGLALRFDWWVVTRKVVLAQWVGPDDYDYKTTLLSDKPKWAADLHRASYRD